MKNILEQMQKQFFDLTVQKDIPLAGLTTLRVGGRADYLLTAEKEETFCGVLRILREENVPCLILGNGSNLLVKDGGFRGAVVRLGKEFGCIDVTEDGLYAQAGALMSVLSRTALEQGFAGLEFAQGIPGTVGGGVYMNAGAYSGEMRQVVKYVRLFDGSEIREVPGEEMAFGYRHSRAMDENALILGAAFRLEKGNKGEIEAKMRDFAQRRRDKQPLEYPSAGSFFKRPEGYFAGALIEQSGLKGKTVGGAQVSEKHAGFLINKGGATAGDFLELMKLVQAEVKKNFGVHLENEVRIVGTDE
ncbi:MAG: UDP-N-acetylmuramate dehydrogenase [Clostridia bacterium]|nr:UDP-N-acetylmuramate dehydrogenase [Clostridia bacterium]